MESFDIVTMRVFLAVARLGSIGAAARNEHIAASAASRRISDLERELGIALISRTPSGTNTTPAGQAFAEHCQQLLNKYAEVRADLKRFAEGEAGELRLAAIPRALAGVLPFFIARFKKDNPEVLVTVQEVFSRQGVRFLREDVSDMAIIYDTVDTTGLKLKPFKEDHVWVVGHKDHPLFRRNENSGTVFFRETLDYEHISFHEGGVLDELVSEARKSSRKSIKFTVRVQRINSLIRCAEAGLGLGIIGERDLQPHLTNANLAMLRLADKWASRNLVCAYPQGQAASPSLKRFLHYLDGDVF
ncbi:MAG: LysR family transcriptional regulator [Desulfopila sp.]|jgi:DNA-binding transcriptional LysR family regulator|nr:LysR family transcriptional regulator [Desulfopila sp.]